MSLELGQLPEQEKPPHSLAAKFGEEETAESVYFATQAIIYTAPDADLTSYRLVNRPGEQYYVLVVGNQPSRDIQERIEGCLTQGMLVNLPPEIIDAAMQRRKEQTQIALYVQRHYRPVPKCGKGYNKKW